MRHLFGFLCVCALGLMPLIGCETADNGGTGGTAGAGGTAGGGGSAGGGGGVVTDCTDLEDGTVCEVGDLEPLGACFDDVCFVSSCIGFEDGTGCWIGGDPPPLGPGFCEGGTCVAVEDCTGIADGVLCDSGEVEGSCMGGECAAFRP